MARVLIIDDDHGMCYTLSNVVKAQGHHVVCKHSVKDGGAEARAGNYDVVFLDVMMPDGSGLDILPMIRKASSNPEVIIITAVGEPEGAELAINSGAWDYLEKPSSLKEMTLPLIRALQYREKKRSGRKGFLLKRERIIGSSGPIMESLNLLAQVAGSDTTVLITGETGTGKELFARALHENSPRYAKNFVVVDCTALTETLVESLLFGHKKGAFTGADRNRPGLVTQADQGTLFLDEIGEMPLATQKRFLRTLQERRFRPIGGAAELESQFRLVAATNRDLEKMVDQGKFRKDLLYRLRSFTIELPPLKDRGGDIKALAMHKVDEICEKYGTEIKGFAPEFFSALDAYGWPGNVRELFNALDRAVAAAIQEPTLFPYHLPADIRAKVVQSTLKGAPQADPDPPDWFAQPHFAKEGFPKIKAYKTQTEKRYLEDLMRLSNGHRGEACRISGLSRTRLYELLKKHGLRIP